jgi:PQQ-like domain
MADDPTTINGVAYRGSIQRLDPSTGATLWETGLPNSVLGRPTMNDGGVIAVGTYDFTSTPNAVCLVDASTGAILRTLTVYFGQSKAIAVDVVIDGKAYPLALKSGSPATGALYSTTMTMPAGQHAFAFYVTDGANFWGDPPNDGTFSGLAVTGAKQAPVRSRIRAPRPNEAPDAYNGG